jgi:ferredoxin
VSLAHWEPVKLTILYFSGTGNTDYVARYLARKLDGAPLDVELRSIEQQAPETVSGYDFLALGFPVYKCDAPDLVQRYAARLPPGKGRGAYVFCTKGAVAGNAVRRNLRRLASRGYEPLGGTSVGMPGSDGLAFVGKGSWMAQAALRKDYDHLRAVDRLAEQMARDLSAAIGGETDDAFRQPLPLGITGALFDRLWVALYDVFSNYLRRSFWVDDRCTGCNLCARICPSSSIEMVRGRPEFGAGCELCMRCIHACPQEAIQMGKWTTGKFRWHGPKGGFRPLRLRPADQATEGVA